MSRKIIATSKLKLKAVGLAFSTNQLTKHFDFSKIWMWIARDKSVAIRQRNVKVIHADSAHAYKRNDTSHFQGLATTDT